MKKKINALKDLEIARLEAKLKAADALRSAKEAGSDIKEDFDSISSIGSTIKDFIKPNVSKRRKSAAGNSDKDFKANDIPWNELGLDLLFQMRREGVNWKSVITPMGLWLLKNGYFEQLISTKKSDIYATLLRFVKKARSK